ncbi:MAG: hypothetical protein H6557_22640 [Lewinellaceae bacterium]|nr:hypothetical protein [Phaeodactylibacter sp.]MCB9039424.1 hypothetical protein [Lewinellaceae bacterium]
MTEDIKIECPKCGWEPDGGAYWSCTCGHVWDTFATAGRCPACNKQWKHTQCIGYKGGCNQFSLHLDWYKGLDGWLERELEAIEKTTNRQYARASATMPGSVTPYPEEAPWA